MANKHKTKRCFAQIVNKRLGTVSGRF